MYKIAIIGTGNVGGALATGFAKAGHTVLLGVKDAENFKGKNLLDNPNTTLHSIETAVTMADIIVVATPATAAVEVAQSLGDTTGKIIIDTMNIVMGRGPAGFTNTTDAILAHTHPAMWLNVSIQQDLKIPQTLFITDTALICL